MNRLLAAVYAVLAIGVPAAAAYLGLDVKTLGLVLGLDFIVAVGLADYLGLPMPALPPMRKNALAAQTISLPAGQSITIVNAVSAAPAPTPTPTPTPTPVSGPAWPIVAIINESTVQADWVGIAAALQLQVLRDFVPFWGQGCSIILTDRAHAPANSWWLVILDNSDQAGALGYHDLTPAGLPIGKVFAKTDLQYGLKSSVTASHELLEMLADPFIDTIKGIYSIGGQNVEYACEVCDAVEADNLGYDINGVQVSDFVTPAWFHPGEPGPYSFRKNVTAPLQLSHGGYISWLALTSKGWQQSTADTIPSALRALGHPRVNPQPGSRRDRRSRGSETWAVSL